MYPVETKTINGWNSRGGMRAKLRPVRWETELEQSADVKNGTNQRAAALLEAEEEATAAAAQEEEWMNYKLKKMEDGFGYVRMRAFKTRGKWGS